MVLIFISLMFHHVELLTCQFAIRIAPSAKVSSAHFVTDLVSFKLLRFKYSLYTLVISIFFQICSLQIFSRCLEMHILFKRSLTLKKFLVMMKINLLFLPFIYQDFGIKFSNSFLALEHKHFLLYVCSWKVYSFAFYIKVHDPFQVNCTRCENWVRVHSLPINAQLLHHHFLRRLSFQ